MADIPTLKTERLVLRPPTMHDWPEYRDLMASDRARYMGGPMTQSAAWGTFTHDVAQWALFGVGALMVETSADNKCVGQVGINQGPLFPEHELGWFLYPSAEGRGYAFEAASRLRLWAFEELQVPSLVSYVDPDNLRSRQLAERLEAVLDPDAARPAPTDLVYRHRSP